MYEINPSSSFIVSALKLVFYIISSGVAIYSFLAIYSLLKFAKSRIIALAASGVYVYIILTLYATALISLGKIKF